MTTDASVWLWGTQIGAVTWLEDREIGVFQYTPQFQSSGIELAPLTMPLAEFPYEFPALARNTFMGLPGLLADSLPDKYGHAVIDAWLASKGQTAASFHPVKRLCYIGSNEPACRSEYCRSCSTGRTRQSNSGRTLQPGWRVYRKRRSSCHRGYPSCGNIGRRCQSQGYPRMERENGRISVRSGRFWGRLRALAHEVRRRCK